jgi:glycerophosphoryl diester phosphodiesterase
VKKYALLLLLLAGCPRVPEESLDNWDGGPLLEGWAVLPADTFAPGPRSGARLDPTQTHGRAIPFPGQPVQGFSALLPEDGGWLALADNGYGAPDNSDDFLLRAYHLQPDFTHHTLRATVAFTLSDPKRLLPYALARELIGDTLLTGADLDPESIQRDSDGTYWIGDELGPFVVRVDAEGRVMEAPYEFRFEAPEEGGACPELHAPAYPMNEEAAALKLAQALRVHAEAHGGVGPVISPNHLLLRDGREDTALELRTRPPTELERSSSEIFDVAALRKAGFEVEPWTVNDPARMRELFALGVSGIISDRPDLLRAEAADAGVSIDVQGHRGARGLRPENTLPAFEAALDVGADTLESDVQLTQDGVPLLWHDFILPLHKCRGGAGVKKAPVIRQTPLAALRGWICDSLQKDFPEQKNAAALSPVSVAFAAAHKLKSPYTPITVDELFEFIAAYEAHYTGGPGAKDPSAAERVASAKKVKFDLETKVNRRRESAGLSPDPVKLTRALLSRIVAHGMIERSMLESFDVGTLLLAQQEVPKLRTLLLFNDAPAGPGLQGDGDNLQPEDDGRSPFLAGMLWPYRRTWFSCAPRVKASGGFEAMGRMPSGKLFAIYEKPVSGAGMLGVVFDPLSRSFEQATYALELPSQVTSVPDVQMTSETTGVMILRDDSEGRLDGYKWVARFELPSDGSAIRPEPVVNLLALRAPWLKPRPEDVGVGDPFAFPFWTIESVLPIGPGRLLIMNDNNYPFSMGRHVKAGQPDDNELIEVRY